MHEEESEESVNMKQMQALLQKGFSTNRTNLTEETENQRKIKSDLNEIENLVQQSKMTNLA